MNQQQARFQALSAFSRAGFTTREAETVVNDPKRRRIITWLMILGNAGLVAVIVTATSSITTSTGYHLPITITVIIIGAFLLYLLAGRSRFARWWDSFIENKLVKSQTTEEDITEELLHFTDGYGLIKLIVPEGSIFNGHALVDVNTADKEFFIVGIERGKEWISLPRAREVISNGDKLVIYGNLDIIKRFFK